MGPQYGVLVHVGHILGGKFWFLDVGFTDFGKIVRVLVASVACGLIPGEEEERTKGHEPTSWASLAL